MANPSLQGNEIVYVVPVDPNGTASPLQIPYTTGNIAALGSSTNSTDVITPLTTVGNGTITAAGIVGRITSRSGPVANFTDTTDTAANIIAALPASAAIGTSFKYDYINNTFNIATITGGTGVTVSNITTVNPGMAATYLLTYTAANTITMAGVSVQSASGDVTSSPATFIFVTSTVTTAVGTTLTASQLSGGYIIRSGPTAAFSDTTDTAANLIAGYNLFGGVPIGTASYILIKNTTNFNETILGGTGVTITGGSVITPNSEASYLYTQTGANTVTLTLAAVGNSGSGLLNTQFNAIATATTFALTGAQMAGALGTYINLTGTLAAATNVQSATAAQIVAAIPNATVGGSYEMRIINSSGAAFAWTLTTNTGVTLTGTQTIAQNTWRDYVVTLTSLTAVTIQAVGTGTQS